MSAEEITVWRASCSACGTLVYTGPDKEFADRMQDRIDASKCQHRPDACAPVTPASDVPKRESPTILDADITASYLPHWREEAERVGGRSEWAMRAVKLMGWGEHWKKRADAAEQEVERLLAAHAAMTAERLETRSW